jgi:hypothetical protein
MVEFSGPGKPLSSDGIAAACDLLGVSAPEIWSVISVETSGFGYLQDRRPKILFERHVFSRLTNHKFDAVNADVSQPTRGGYGPGGAHQHDRLAAAIQLDRDAALQSASWGLGQIMGENFAAAGFQTAAALVDATMTSEDGQLQAMAAFIKANSMDGSLRNHDWARFARGYNGPDFAANNYDGLLGQFFGRYSTGPVPDLAVRAAQIYLTYKGFAPNGVDGIAGRSTAAAVKAFQTSAQLAVTGVIDAALLSALSA